jgi:hypothetical protein
MGQNGKGIFAAIYWLKCPKCKEFIVCIKESSRGYEVLGNLKELNLQSVIYPKL